MEPHLEWGLLLCTYNKRALACDTCLWNLLRALPLLCWPVLLRLLYNFRYMWSCFIGKTVIKLTYLRICCCSNLFVSNAVGLQKQTYFLSLLLFCTFFSRLCIFLLQEVIFLPLLFLCLPFLPIYNNSRMLHTHTCKHQKAAKRSHQQQQQHTGENWCSNTLFVAVVGVIIVAICWYYSKFARVPLKFIC